MNSELKFCLHQQSLEFYCQNCEIFLCKYCNISMHEIHSYQKIEIFIKEKLKIIENKIESSKKAINEMPKIENIQLIVEDKFNRIFNEIFQKIKAQIENFKKIVIMEFQINNILDEKKKIEFELENTKINLEQIISDEKIFDKKFILEKIQSLSSDKDSLSLVKFKNLMIEISEKLQTFTEFKIRPKIKPNFTEKILDGLIANFSQKLDKIEKIKIPEKEVNFKSTIALPNQMDFVFKEIKKVLDKKVNYSLLFRASKHGFSSENFHKKCDGKCPILVLIHSEYKKKFGGFADASFSSTKNFVMEYSNDAFLFSIDNQTIHLISEEAKKNSILNFHENGPTFGGGGLGSDLYISDDCENNSNSHTRFFGNCYTLPKKIKANSNEAQQWLSGSKKEGYFKVIDYEVFECF